MSPPPKKTTHPLFSTCFPVMSCHVAARSAMLPHYTAHCVAVPTVHCCSRPPIFRTDQQEEASCKQDYDRRIRSSAPINKIIGRTDMNSRHSNNHFSYYQNRNACSGLLIVLQAVLLISHVLLLMFCEIFLLRVDQSADSCHYKE